MTKSYQLALCIVLLLAYFNLGDGVFQQHRRQNATYHAPAQNYQPYQPYNNTRYPAGGYRNLTGHYQPSAPQPNYGFNQPVHPNYPVFGGHYNNSRPYRPNNSTRFFAKFFGLG